MNFLNEQTWQKTLATLRTTPFIAVSLVLIIHGNSSKFASKCTVLLVQM